MTREGPNWSDEHEVRNQHELASSTRSSGGPIMTHPKHLSDWSETDNTPEGGAARIRWLLEYGVPRNAKAQRNGRAPLCYMEKTNG